MFAYKSRSPQDMIRSGKQVRCGHGYLVDDEDGDILKCAPERVGWVVVRLEPVVVLEEAMERDAAYVPRGGGRCSGYGHALSHVFGRRRRGGEQRATFRIQRGRSNSIGPERDVGKTSL